MIIKHKNNVFFLILALFVCQIYSSLTLFGIFGHTFDINQQFFFFNVGQESRKMRNFAVCMTEQKKSIYQRAGEWGIPFGLYLACAALASIFADWFQPLAFIFMILLLATPVVVYYFQRRKFIEDDGFTEHAGLWMLGILLFILGSVISGFIVYLVVQFFRPEFLYEQADAAIKMYSEIPQMQDSELLKVLQQMVDKRMLPTPIEMVFNAFWFVTFFGSILSAVTAFIARRPLKRYRR